MLRFEVRPSIRHVRNTEVGPFLMLRFEVRPVIRHVRNTEGGPFLMLRFKVCPEIIFRSTDGGPFLILHFKIHAFQNVCKNYRGWTNSYTWFKIHPEFLFGTS